MTKIIWILSYLVINAAVNCFCEYYVQHREDGSSKIKSILSAFLSLLIVIPLPWWTFVFLIEVYGEVKIFFKWVSNLIRVLWFPKNTPVYVEESRYNADKELMELIYCKNNIMHNRLHAFYFKTTYKVIDYKRKKLYEKSR